MTRRRLGCSRCEAPAVFVVAAGDPDTFWYRTQSTCLRCLPRAKRWAAFVGPVTVTSLDQPGTPVQGALFDMPRKGRR